MGGKQDKEKKKAYMKQYRLRPEVKERKKKYLEETKEKEQNNIKSIIKNIAIHHNILNVSE